MPDCLFMADSYLRLNRIHVRAYFLLLLDYWLNLAHFLSDEHD